MTNERGKMFLNTFPSIIIKIIGVATWGGVRGAAALCKRSRYSNRAVSNSNKTHIVVKEVVYL